MEGFGRTGDILHLTRSGSRCLETKPRLHFAGKDGGRSDSNHSFGWLFVYLLFIFIFILHVSSNCTKRRIDHSLMKWPTHGSRFTVHSNYLI